MSCFSYIIYYTIRVSEYQQVFYAIFLSKREINKKNMPNLMFTQNMIVTEIISVMISTKQSGKLYMGISPLTRAQPK